jgi:simple sugar transport system permease protein
MDAILSTTTLAAALLLCVPYVLAALGGVCSERSGVVNIALEGMLLTGAFAAAAVTDASGSPWLGLAAAALAGVVTALLLAIFVLVARVDQIIAGLAINLMMAGATRVGAQLIWGKTHSDAITSLPPLAPGGATDSPLAHAFLGQPMVLLAIAAVVLVTILFSRTVLGLRLRAVGEHPEAAASVGLSVTRLRLVALTLSGLLAGLGGAWLAFDVSQFSDGMSAGKGYIAMAAVIFGRWHPLGAASACLVFGAAGALAEAFERAGIEAVPSQLIGALPYVLTIIALVGLIGRSRPPAALGRR